MGTLLVRHVSLVSDDSSHSCFPGDDQICYAPYGCFSNEAPFNRRFVQLPESPHVVGTKFMVYTRLQSKNPDIISDADPSSIKTSTFDGSKPTIFIAHGYLGKLSLDVLRMICTSTFLIRDRQHRLRFVSPISSHLTILSGSVMMVLVFTFMAQVVIVIVIAIVNIHILMKAPNPTL